MPEDAIDLEGFGNAPKRLASQGFHREIALDQAVGIRANRHRIGGRKALDPGRNVRGFA